MATEPNSIPAPGDAAIDAAFGPFAGAPLAMVLVDQSGRIVRANPRLEALFEYDPGELSGQPIAVLVPPKARGEHDFFVSAFFDYPTTRRMSQRRDLAGHSKLGTSIPVEIGLTTIQAGDTLMAVAWVFDLKDQTDRDEQFRLVVEGSPNGVLLVDHGGKIVLCNERASLMFGYTREELLGESIDLLVPKHVGPKHRVYRSNFHESPRQRSMGSGRDLHALRRDGSEFPVEIGLTPIETHKGAFTVTTVIDISGRKEVEEKLRRTNEELLSFAYSASHDLKAPLATICGLSDVVLDSLDSGDLVDAKARVGDIRSKAGRLASLVESVLALAQADRAGQPSEAIAIPALLEDIYGEFADDCLRLNVALRTDHQSQGSVFAERERLAVILRNLVGNGIKYRNPEQQEPSVTVSTRDEADRIYFDVSDNGLGIPEKNADQVFQMFRRFHEESFSGNGLGLAIVKKQVDYLNGEISFSSSKEGTTFHVSIPAGPLP